MNNELYHFGVKGMKWGRRRYQNADGSLTSAGKKRYAKDLQKEYGKLEDQMTYGKNANAKKNAMLEKRMSEIEKELNPKSKKAAEKAAKKLVDKKMKDLQKEYGKLEDQMTYGKNANAKKNAMLEKRMDEIEKRMAKR